MEWLASPWTVLSILIITAGLVTLAILGFRFRVSKDGLDASREASKPLPTMPDKYARALVEAVERASEHQYTLLRLQNEAMESQMRTYEELSYSAVAILKDAFREIAATKGLSAEDTRREAREYLYIVKAAINDTLKTMTRRWFKINHYAEKSESEWQTYLELKRQTILHIVQEAIDRDWASELVTREDIRAIGDHHKNCISRVIDQTFNAARFIAIEKQEQMEAEKALYSKYMNELAGIDPYATTTPKREV